MHRSLRPLLLFVPVIVLFTACNKGIPDHARYIPKDAVAVAGLNLKSLGKKIAWNVITGSKLFKEIQDRVAARNTKDAVGGIDKAGIDFSNTVYVYVKTDNRFKGGNRITGLVPLSDAGQWEAYVKQAFPQVEIKQVGDRKEARLGSDMYVGWTKKLMIVINAMPAGPDVDDIINGRGTQPSGPAPDVATIAAEMDNAFHVQSSNSIISNAHFTALELAGHDVTFLLNYDQIMSQYSGEMAQKMGVSLSSMLWKDAAFAFGFDFVKGKITGDMNYYLSSDMSDVGAKLGGTNVDKGMLDRLPGQNMDILFALHIAPPGIRALMDKMNLYGLANAGLSTQGLSVDNVLDAFTGDMALVVNDFSLHSETVTDNFMGQTIVHQNQKPSVNIMYVIRINKKQNFQKLVDIAKDNGLPRLGNGFVIPVDEKDSIYILTNDQYAVASNNLSNATNFLQGNNSQKLADAVNSQAAGHPVGFYLDVQQLFKNIDPSVSNSPHDSAMIAESKKLINNISFSGGNYKDNAFEYHLDINFVNTEENSIINLMDYGMRMSDADKIKGGTGASN